MAVKKRYKVNASNNLLVKDKKTALLLDGNFSINKDNKLIYLLNEPSVWRKKYSLPGRIKFEGGWRINSKYELALDVTKAGESWIREELILRGDIIAADKDALAFEVQSKDKNGNTHFRVLKLKGFWQADDYNRLCFLVNKKNGSPDEIVFSGAWQVNKNQQISYTYEKTDLVTKKKRIHTLTFEGFWQITEANRLKYILSGGNKSAFDFRVQIENPSLYPQQGKIKYRLGIGYSRHKDQAKDVVTLYGTWKFSRRAGIDFEMDYGRSGLHSLEFNLERHFTDTDTVTLGLSSKGGEPLGIAVVFSRRLFQSSGAEAYLKLRKTPRETSAWGGFKTTF